MPKHTPSERKKNKVFSEFKRGKLRSSSGVKVTKREQAAAIARSEGRRVKRKRRT